ncbi:DUF2570 domain-containing protein [Buttiauxella sp. B2]|uniref:DUF2570 domain-containing protein n=1 Tax=Buttiauxella sp. B2 TaxID=2587812 RepID=UPI0011228407|nr:DUF2570 domain-containing protein [Buttiauxella sp. B2]TNV22843.1 DUF2570 domain-containing protein [Buttiauxella sp. B2]
MKMRFQLLLTLFVICLAGGLVYSADYYHSKYQDEKKRADEAIQDAESAKAITSNVLRIVAITNTVLEANQHAKQQIALESQRAQADIKVAVANDDCTNRAVPAGASKRLHDYADSLRNSSTSTSTSQPDR